jgi:hypothetical protein
MGAYLAALRRLEPVPNEAAVAALGSVDGAEVVRVLALELGPRHAAVAVLGPVDGAEVVRVLALELGPQDAAAAVLGPVDGVEVVPVLAPALGSQDAAAVVLTPADGDVAQVSAPALGSDHAAQPAALEPQNGAAVVQVLASGLRLENAAAGVPASPRLATPRREEVVAMAQASQLQSVAVLSPAQRLEGQPQVQCGQPVRQVCPAHESPVRVHVSQRLAARSESAAGLQAKH